MLALHVTRCSEGDVTVPILYVTPEKWYNYKDDYQFSGRRQRCSVLNQALGHQNNRRVNIQAM